MSSQSLTRVVRGGLWLYLRDLANTLSGFIYWMAISAVGGAEIVGLTSATIALASIVSGFLSLGEEAGVRRFVGTCKGRGDREGIANYFWTTALFTMITFIPIGLAMMALSLLGLSFGSLGSHMLFYGGIIVLLVCRLHIYEERAGQYLGYFKHYVDSARMVVDVGCGADIFSRALARR